MFPVVMFPVVIIPVVVMAAVVVVVVVVVSTEHREKINKLKIYIYIPYLRLKKQMKTNRNLADFAQ